MSAMDNSEVGGALTPNSEKMEVIVIDSEEESVLVEIIEEDGVCEKFAANLLENAFIGYNWFRRSQVGPSKFQCAVCDKNFVHPNDCFDHVPTREHLNNMCRGETRHKKEVICNLLEIFNKCIEDVKRESSQKSYSGKVETLIKLRNLLNFGKMHLLRFLDSLEDSAVLTPKCEEIEETHTDSVEENMQVEIINEDGFSENKVTQSVASENFADMMIENAFIGYNWFCRSQLGPSKFQCSMCNKSFDTPNQFVVHIVTSIHLKNMLIGKTSQGKKEVICNLLKIFRKCILKLYSGLVSKTYEGNENRVKQKRNEITSLKDILMRSVRHLLWYLDIVEEIMTDEDDENGPVADNSGLKKRKENPANAPVSRWDEFLSILKKIEGYKKCTGPRPGGLSCSLCKKNFGIVNFIKHLGSPRHMENLTVSGMPNNSEATEILFQHLAAVTNCHESVMSLSINKDTMGSEYFRLRNTCKEVVEAVQEYLSNHVEFNIYCNQARLIREQGNVV